MTDTIKKQILSIKNSENVNMFDINMVLLIAEREEFSDLISFIENNQTEYIQFVMSNEG